MAKAKTAEEFDSRFDQGEDIFDLADIKPEDIKRPGQEDFTQGREDFSQQKKQ